jgi:hypothetical protein
LISDTICALELVVVGAAVGVYVLNSGKPGLHTIVIGGGVKTSIDWLLVIVVGDGVLTTVLTTGGFGVEVTGGGVILVSGGTSVVT